MKRASKKRRIITPQRIWIFIFSFWTLVISGFLSQQMGSPGISQVIQLKELKALRETQLTLLEEDIVRLQNEKVLLDTSPLFQEREIRKSLGFVATDEIIFEFQREALGPVFASL